MSRSRETADTLAGDVAGERGDRADAVLPCWPVAIMRPRSTTTTPRSKWDASRGREVGDLDTAGVYHGHDGVRAYWRRWLSAWEDVEATEVEFVDGGQTVVALIHRQRLRGRGSGIEVDAPPYALAFV